MCPHMSIVGFALFPMRDHVHNKASTSVGFSYWQSLSAASNSSARSMVQWHDKGHLGTESRLLRLPCTTQMHLLLTLFPRHAQAPLACIQSQFMGEHALRRSERQTTTVLLLIPKKRLNPTLALSPSTLSVFPQWCFQLVCLLWDSAIILGAAMIPRPLSGPCVYHFKYNQMWQHKQRILWMVCVWRSFLPASVNLISSW